jgi:hypothetical protein
MSTAQPMVGDAGFALMSIAAEGSSEFSSPPRSHTYRRRADLTGTRPGTTQFPCSSSCSNSGPGNRSKHVQIDIRSPANRVQTLEIGLGGRASLEFGTVGPGVQIPGPDQRSEFGFVFLRLYSARIQGPHGFSRTRFISPDPPNGSVCRTSCSNSRRDVARNVYLSIPPGYHALELTCRRSLPNIRRMTR